MSSETGRSASRSGLLRRIHPAVFWPLAIALCVALACLLAAPVHEVLMDLGVMTRHTDAANHDRYFLKVFRRLLLVLPGAVFLWRVRPWRERGSGYGLRPVRAGLRPAAIGFAAAVLAVTGVLLWQHAMGWLRLESPLRWGEFAWRLTKFAVGGLLIGFLEEWFFRGWLTDRFRRLHGLRAAVVLSSIVYAVAHAFRPRAETDAVTHDAAGAFEALCAWSGYALSVPFLASASGLFCFALLLTAVYRRTGTLWAPIGVHAGAVLVLSSYGALTERLAGPPWAGDRLLYDCLPVAGSMLLGAWLLRPRPALARSEQTATSDRGTG